MVKLGDTHVAFDDELNVLWTYQTKWVDYSKCPAYIPAVGDIDGDKRDEVNSGYFMLDGDGKLLPGTYTVSAELVNHDHSPLSPPVIDFFRIAVVE